MSLSKLKITAAGWETFTGDFASTQFVDGVSVEALPRHVIDRISSIVLCELVAEDGATDGQAGAGMRVANASDIPAEVIEPLDRMTDEQLAAERKAALDAALHNPATKLYTQDQLEAIASTEGLKGVREIGDKWGVKERAIAKLIDLILKAQDDYSSKVDQREAATKALREQATADAIKVQQDREAAITAQARNLSAETEAKLEAAVQAALEAGKPKIHRVVNGGLTVDITEPVTPPTE